MSLLVVGISHKSASVALREQIAFVPEAFDDAHSSLLQVKGVRGAMLLSTCNRTEILIAGEVQADLVYQWLAGYQKADLAALQSAGYAFADGEAAKHLMRVAAGLESLVLGEPQIFGQLKSAYAVAKESGAIDSELHRAVQHSFNVAKRIRTETAIGENPVSVAFAAVSLASRIFDSLASTTALLIGAGETIELVAKHLVEQGVQNVLIANRTLANAAQLAERTGGHAILLSDLPNHLAEADIVISSTASQLPILGKGAVESAMAVRRGNPMFIVDIAVPRDVEPEVESVDGVYLYTVDDLKDVIDEGMRQRHEAANAAEQIVHEGVGQFEHQVRTRASAGAITDLRDSVASIKDAELRKALSQLQAGVAPEQVLQRFAHSLTNKLLHQPTTQLRQAGVEQNEELVTTVRALFALDHDQSKSED